MPKATVILAYVPDAALGSDRGTAIRRILLTAKVEVPSDLVNLQILTDGSIVTPPEEGRVLILAAADMRRLRPLKESMNAKYRVISVSLARE